MRNKPGECSEPLFAHTVLIVPPGDPYMVDFFISYRTSDEPATAVLIEQALSARFGPGCAFLDTKTIPIGRHFPTETLNTLRGCHTLLAVIGPNWLETNDRGRRIDEPDDYVHQEIAIALRQRIRVVPVLIGDAVLPSPGDLPTDIAELSERQGFRMRVRGVQADIERLVGELAGPTQAFPTAPVAEPPVPPAPGSYSAENMQVINGPVHATTVGFSTNRP